MKNIALGLLLCLFSVSVGCMPAPTTGVLVDNLNPGTVDAPLIRAWVLSEEEIANPPTTRAEAESVQNLVTYPFNLYEFLREPGTYFVVASNETHFQSLAPDDAFELGVDFAVLQVEVSDGKVTVGAINTNTPTLLPELSLL